MHRYIAALFLTVSMTACGTKQGVVPNAVSAFPAAQNTVPHSTKGLKVTPSTLTLYGKGAASATTVAVAESKYTGKFKEKDTCINVAAISPTSGKGPSLNVTLTGVGKGKCTVTFSDTKGHKATLTVTDKNGGRLVTSMLIPIGAPRDKRGHRHFGPKFISPSTQAMTVKITGPGVSIDEVTGLTALSPGCTLTLQGLACTFAQSLPSCSSGAQCYTAAFTTYDAYDSAANAIPSGAAALSTSTSKFSIANNETNAVTFNFSGIPAQIAVVPGTPLVAQSGNVYDLIGPGAHNLFAEAIDADGNVISGIGAPHYTVGVSGPLAATVTQPPEGSPRFTITPPATLADSAALGSLTVTGAYGAGQTDGCAVTGAICSSSVGIDMQSLLAVAGGYSISLFAAEKGTGPVSTITSGVLSGSTDIEYDAHGNLYTAETTVGIHEYKVGSTIPSRTMSIPGGLVTKLALDPSGNLFVLDVSANKVFEYPPGATTPSLTLNIASSKGYAYFLSVDSGDDLWVGYVKFDTGEAVEPGGGVNFYPHGSTTPASLSGLVAPVGMALDPVTKTLYVSDQTQYTFGHPYPCSDATPCALYAYTFGSWSSPTSIGNPAYAGDLAVLDETIHPTPYDTVTIKGVFQDDADGTKFALYNTAFAPPVTPSAFTAGLDSGSAQAMVVDELGNMFVAATQIGSVYGYRYSTFNAGGTAESISPFVTLTSGLSNPHALAIVP
ncbi:MAG TPA: hypothetical protein VFE36_09255 [Candidatus Baltobacteraceae bacterium]|nr:hypothetical protein [Candidatus Baltobacteraceae bacterium]